MSPQEIMKTYLTSVSQITDVCSAIYEDEAPLHAKDPMIVCYLIDGEMETGLVFKTPLIQTSVYGKSRATVKQVIDLVVDHTKNNEFAVGSYLVRSTYQTDRLIREKTWWHGLTETRMKYQEVN
jgi:hypothetical protein